MDKIKFRQFLCITFLIAIAMKMFMLPVLLMRVSGRDSFIVMLLVLTTELALLAIVATVIYLSGEKNLYELLRSAFGNVASKIIVAIVSVFYLFKLFMSLVDVRIFFSTSVFSHPLEMWHVLPVILLVLYFAMKPLSSIGRLSELFTPIVIVSMIVLGCLTLPEVEFGGLNPLLAEGWAPIGSGYTTFSMWYGDFTILLMLTGKVANNGKKVYFSLIPAVIAFVFLMVFSSVLFAAYGDMTEVLTYGHNISNMTQYAVGSYKFGRFDLVIFCVWLTAVLLSAGMMMSFFARGMDYVLGKKVGKTVTVIAALVMLIFTAVLQDLNRVTEFITRSMWIPSMIIQYGFPIVCIAAVIVNKVKSKMKGRTKKGEALEPQN